MFAHLQKYLTKLTANNLGLNFLLQEIDRQWTTHQRDSRCVREKIQMAYERVDSQGHVMCVYSWTDSHLFISGGQDGDVLFWDRRLSEAVHKVSFDNFSKGGDKCVNSACVDPTGM